MDRDARAEGLNLEGIVADITTFSPEGEFDILLFDRVLHMLDARERAAVLARLLAHVAPGGQVLIIDEPRNIPALEQVLQENARDWRPTLKRRGFLFLREANDG
jgi:trans-aconitate methyltransferase